MLVLNNLHFSIDGKKVLDAISTRFDSEKIHGIIGPNGSGKTTLLKNICRIWKPQSGTIEINGQDCASMSRRDLSALVTLVPQNTAIAFPVSVFDIVAMGRNPRMGSFGGLTRNDREVVEYALRKIDILELKDRNINELSGGEEQLAIIARAVATEASLILLDEPTSDLDIRHTLKIIKILLGFKEQGKTILMTVHDLNLARKYCDTITIMHVGKIVFSGLPEEAFSDERIRRAFQVNVRKHTHNDATFLDFCE